MTQHLIPQEQCGRRALPHEPPHYIGTADAVFFITICCKPKGLNQLCYRDVARQIFTSAQHYHGLHYWTVPLLVLMPDHLHMLVSFSDAAGMKKVVTNWKRYVARQIGIQWQRFFFDHRLRA